VQPEKLQQNNDFAAMAMNKAMVRPRVTLVNSEEEGVENEGRDKNRLESKSIRS